MKIYGTSPYASPTDMGVNMVGNCIINDDACREASRQEIIRRYYKALVGVADGTRTEEELNKFRDKWNLPEYNLDGLMASIQQFRYVDAFLMNATVDNSPTGQYLQLFSRTLSLYFAANTAPNEEGKYISSFKSQEFYDSFKNLVQAKYDADAMEKNVKLLKVEDVTDGQKANIEKIVANCKRKYFA